MVKDYNDFVEDLEDEVMFEKEVKKVKVKVIKESKKTKKVTKKIEDRYLVEKKSSGISIFRKPDKLNGRLLKQGDSIKISLTSTELNELKFIKKNGKSFKRNDIDISKITKISKEKLNG